MFTFLSTSVNSFATKLGKKEFDENVCLSVTSQFPVPSSLSQSSVYSVLISSQPSNDNKVLNKASMAVISMAKLLFWMTQVPLFTLRAWERTSGQWTLHWKSPFSNLATTKSLFRLGRRRSLSFVCGLESIEFQNAELQIIPVPGLFESGGFYWLLHLQTS